jgi:hypothetical protein
MVALKTLKTLQHVSIQLLDHPQGARMFLVKVTDQNSRKSNLGDAAANWIETCWSVLSVFSATILDKYIVIYS